MKTYLIIADDFTGSNDSGLELSLRGIETIIGFAAPKSTEGSFVLDTESRNIDGKEAYKVTKALIEDLDFDSYDVVLKKIDSTLRGNILEEVQAIDERMKPELILVAPAFVAMGRTCIGGEVFVNDGRLLETEFADDPLKPVLESNLVTLFSASYETALLMIDDLWKKKFPDLTDKKVVVCDATQEEDLIDIVTWAKTLKKRILYVGSAGIAAALIQVDQPKAPSLAVVASLSQATRDQLEYAQYRSVATIALDVLDLLKGDDPSAFIEEGVQLLKKGEDVILTLSSALDRTIYQRSLFVGRELGMSDSMIGKVIKERLSEIALAIIEKSGVRNLYLSGGETAFSLMEMLGITEVKIVGEVAVGIPITLVLDGPYKGVRIVTKAGGFGEAEAITYSLRRLGEVRV